MRKNNKLLNEFTPMGWMVVGGAIVVFILLLIVGFMIVRTYV